MKYYGGHNFPNNNVNTVTLFLMYLVIRISCLLRAILAELRSGAMKEALQAVKEQRDYVESLFRSQVRAGVLQ